MSINKTIWFLELTYDLSWFAQLLVPIVWWDSHLSLTANCLLPPPHVDGIVGSCVMMFPPMIRISAVRSTLNSRKIANYQNEHTKIGAREKLGSDKFNRQQ